MSKAKNPSPRKPAKGTADAPDTQGEGNDGKVDEAARAAQPRDTQQAEQMRRAEQAGRSHSKGEDDGTDIERRGCLAVAPLTAREPQREEPARAGSFASSPDQLLLAFASATAFACAALASFTHCSLSLPFLSSHISFATSYAASALARAIFAESAGLPV